MPKRHTNIKPNKYTNESNNVCGTFRFNQMHQNEINRIHLNVSKWKWKCGNIWMALNYYVRVFFGDSARAQSGSIWIHMAIVSSPVAIFGIFIGLIPDSDFQNAKSMVRSICLSRWHIIWNGMGDGGEEGGAWRSSSLSSLWAWCSSQTFVVYHRNERMRDNELWLSDFGE